MGKVTLPYTVLLNTPVQPGEKVHTEIVFKNPLTMGMMETLIAGEAMTFADMFPLLRGMTGLSVEVFRAMCPDDFAQLVDVLNPFLTSGPKPSVDSES